MRTGTAEIRLARRRWKGGPDQPLWMQDPAETGWRQGADPGDQHAEKRPSAAGIAAFSLAPVQLRQMRSAPMDQAAAGALKASVRI